MDNFGDFKYVVLSMGLNDEEVLVEYHNAVKREKVKRKLISKLSKMMDQLMLLNVCGLDADSKLLNSWVDHFMKEEDPIKAIEETGVLYIGDENCSSDIIGWNAVDKEE